MIANSKPRQWAHIKRGIKIDGITFRSKMEAHIYQYLRWLCDKGQLANLEYEPMKYHFPFSGGSNSYTPDFGCWDNWKHEQLYFEVKGYMDAKSKTKLRRMKIHYPKIHIEVIDKKAYKAIIKDTKGLVNYE